MRQQKGVNIMKASPQDILTAKLFFIAAFPVLKVVIQEDEATRKSWENVEAVVQFRAKDEAGDLVCHLVFDNLDLKVIQGAHEKPDIEFQFSSVAKMVRMLKGSPTALPDVGSLIKCVAAKPALTLNFLMTLMKLKLMLPSAKLKNDMQKYLKVKLSLYMITTALSTANKLGWEGISRWTIQPDRIYQFIVGDIEKPVIACYLRVKAGTRPDGTRFGNSKAGRGVYDRKTPFVLFHFSSVDGALNILLKKKEFVKGVEDGDIEVIGAPEYGVQLNDIMAILQDMLTAL
jgi:hypothetical protein